MKNNEKEELSITGIARDRKVACSSPGRSGGGIFSPVSTFCADSYFGIRSTRVLPQ